MNKPQVSATRSGLGTWFDHHLYSLMASLGRAVRKPWATLLTIGVMAVALSLPVGLGLILQNVERFAGSVQASREISVFLRQDTSLERARALAEQLNVYNQKRKDSENAILEEAERQLEANADWRLNNSFHQLIWPGELGLSFVDGVTRKLTWRERPENPGVFKRLLKALVPIANL